MCSQNRPLDSPLVQVIISDYTGGCIKLAEVYVLQSNSYQCMGIHTIIPCRQSMYMLCSYPCTCHALVVASLVKVHVVVIGLDKQQTYTCRRWHGCTGACMCIDWVLMNPHAPPAPSGPWPHQCP